MACDLALSLGGGFYVSDWVAQSTGFFCLIEITKSMLFLILLLVVAVAAFNIVAALVMVVKDKREDIAILRTLGGTLQRVAVFSLQGALIGLAGTVTGALFGVLIAVNLRRWSTDSSTCSVRTSSMRVSNSMSDLPAYPERTDALKNLRGGVCAACTGHALSGLARRADTAGPGAAP